MRTRLALQGYELVKINADTTQATPVPASLTALSVNKLDDLLTDFFLLTSS